MDRRVGRLSRGIDCFCERNRARSPSANFGGEAIRPGASGRASGVTGFLELAWRLMKVPLPAPAYNPFGMNPSHPGIPTAKSVQANRIPSHATL